MKPCIGGLFFIGTDTGVGKTYVAALVARQLVQDGHVVGVYKPVASGCRREGGELVSDDAVALWEAAGRPGILANVCPQRFEASLAPPAAARAVAQRVDPLLLRSGLQYWLERSGIVLVEGVGGLFSPVTEDETVGDLARDFALPLVIVARNALGTINHTLLTVRGVELVDKRLTVGAVVLNDVDGPRGDSSRATNRGELFARLPSCWLTSLARRGTEFDDPVDWLSVAQRWNARR